MDTLFPVFQRVMARMPASFDAHDFILELLKLDPVIYFSILKDYGERVFQTNAYISNHLKDNAEAYDIVYVGKNISKDIYQNDRECAVFNKK